ncbi:surface lipoprotein assembly modifier [Hoeflea sp. G2-23]|uniref:Surface lipoprotein assembly modifier n=1 Tax=Hoeflea algicola TaxID=2983763 RepID=A0ABT3Z650_9HYPH|nr:surface lipoprotein assembly modifier [Hoeflea algicola]MCY0146781.1 surface lipoprotein assembly modifier [Hoeflea algicola]
MSCISACCRLFVLGVCITALGIFQAVAVAAPAQQPNAIIGLLEAGEYDAARDELRRFLAGRKDTSLHIAHLEGLIARHKGEDAKAVEIFRFILSRQPNFTPSRIELAKTLASEGHFDSASYQLRIIELSSDDPEVRRQATSFGSAIRDQKPLSFSGYFSILPSTNVNRGTGNKTITIGGAKFVINDEGRQQSGVGVAAGGSFRRGFALGDQRQILWSGAVDTKKYQDRQFDETTLSTSVAIAQKLRGFNAEIGLTADHQWRGWQPYMLRYGVFANTAYKLMPLNTLSFGGSLRRQEYDDRFAYRDGWIARGSIAFHHAYTPTLSMMLSANVTAERTTLNHLDHNDLQGQFQINKNWAGGLMTNFFAKAETHHYLGPFPGTTITRNDTLWSLGMTASHRDFSYHGFRPEISYQYTKQISNISFYDYDTHDIGIYLTRNF